MPSQCSWLTGALSLIKDEAGRKLEVNNFRYILTEGPAVKKLQNGVAIGSPNAKDAPIVVPGRGKYDEFKDGVRDYKCGMLLKMGKTSLFSYLIFHYVHIKSIRCDRVQNWLNARWSTPN